MLLFVVTGPGSLKAQFTAVNIKQEVHTVGVCREGGGFMGLLGGKKFSAFQMSQKRFSGLLDSEGEEEGRMIWENGIETCIISYMKRVTSPGSMHA